MASLMLMLLPHSFVDISWLHHPLPTIVNVEHPKVYTIDPNNLTITSAFVEHKITIIHQPDNANLTVPKGFQVNVFASGDPPNTFVQPRQMTLAPNGDVFITDSRAGIVYALRDADRNGVADARFTFATGLKIPFGLAFNSGYLYVATVQTVVRFAYTNGQTQASGAPETIAELTKDDGPHFTRDIKFSPDGKRFYVAIGSKEDEKVQSEPQRAAICVFNADGSNRTIYAAGLRNPITMAFNPADGELWTTVNERDELADKFIPDYVTSVKQGEFYGYPYSYIGKNPDPGLPQDRPDLVQRTLVPDVLLDPHAAPLGIEFYTGKMFPADYQGDAFVALHGSKFGPIGYNVVRVRFQNGKVVKNEFEDFVTGWLTETTNDTIRVWGRPMGVLTAADGSLLISDDGANKIWRVSYQNDSNEHRKQTF
ncbi:hypothetical protein RvY_10993 [Ramazzottius varieornatus]|uniref:Pyrroloquinoline quinone-dependent pyranose dehydrogenase beta-propeller domain-containing protein n=1 Tax=Ramazzottius varieornatus TaxID=947166 RepID=A0A1D1VH31_RAMVA|nr:hypothetical protein RvY_10993 [Ramazzottius varieornatus]